MQNTTSAETGTAQASRPDISAGDSVNVPATFHLMRKGVNTGTVESVRRRACGKWEAYVVIENVRWIFPLAQLKKIASGE
jgi:ABC-type proline/glycine betaine transport system substrate-binding protein